MSISNTEYLFASARTAFIESSLKTAVMLGARQYILLPAGSDTFAYRRPDWAGSLQIIEADTLSAQNKKRMELIKLGIAAPDSVKYVPIEYSESGFELLSRAVDSKKPSFFGLFDAPHHLNKAIFETMLKAIKSMMSVSSSLAFSYPSKLRKNDGYSYLQMQKLLSDCGFRIYEHLTPIQIEHQLINRYFNPIDDAELCDFSLCLAVRKPY